MPLLEAHAEVREFFFAHALHSWLLVGFVNSAKLFDSENNVFYGTANRFHGTAN